MKTKDRLLRAAFVSLALGIAWSIRGDYGGIMGVGYCGAVLGMGFACVSGQRAMFKWMPLLAAAAALSIYPTVTYYEPFHAYACNKTFVNYSYGLFGLILQGGGWACFACCLIGLMLEKEPLRASEWASVIATVFVSAFLVYYVVVTILNIHLTYGPPYAISRSGIPTDKIIGVNGGVIGLLVWLIWNKKRYGLKAAVIGYIAFGLGMSGGRFLANVRDYSTWKIGDWYVLQGLFSRFGNVMEINVGLIGGFLFTYGMLGKKAPELPEGKHCRLLSVYSIFYVLAGIPILLRVLRVSGSVYDGDTGLDKLHKWMTTFQQYGYADPAKLAARIPTAVSLVCVLAVVGAVVWLLMHSRNKYRFAAFPVLCLSAVMIVIQNIEHRYLFYPIGDVSLKMFLFPGMFLLMLLFAIFVKTPEVTEPDEVDERVNWRRWLLGAVVAYAFMVVLSGPVNAGRRDKVPLDQMRFSVGDKIPIPWRSGH